MHGVLADAELGGGLFFAVAGEERFQRLPQAPIARQQLTDLDIPTFIRRQMD